MAPNVLVLYGQPGCHPIPVLLINGRKAFKYRLTERELPRRLAREGRGRTRHQGVIRGYANHCG